MMVSVGLLGQDIQLENPSFEGFATAGRLPYGWRDCGFPGESPPDIQPGSWGVEMAAQNGNTYLGMVTRRRDTWECVSQELQRPMSAGQCYMFSIYLRKGDHYLSPESGLPSSPHVPFTQAITLRIWGGHSPNRGAELLAESGLVESTDWKKYFFKLEPREDYQYFFLEAFYKTPVLMPYNGNILLDNASDLVAVDCEATVKEEVQNREPFVSFVSMKTKSKERSNHYNITFSTQNVDRRSDISLKMNNQKLTRFDFDARSQKGSFTADLAEGINTFDITVVNSFGKHSDQTDIFYKPEEKQTTSPPVTPPATKEPVASNAKPQTQKPEPSTKIEKEVTSARLGQKIVIEDLQFAANESIINPRSYSILDDLALALKHNPNIIIEIGGHTNGMPKDEFCDRLSTARAMAVYDYLQNAGVPTQQLTYKGYGKRSPIASNKTKEGRKQNQRVEIKIISS